MERHLKLQIIDEEYKRQIRSKKLAFCILFAGIGACVLLVCGFFLLQHLISSRINSYPAENGTDFSSVDIHTCKDELNVDDWGEDFNTLSFFQMGWDNDGRPVWMLELGKLDIRGMLEKDEGNAERIAQITVESSRQIICSMKQAEPKLKKQTLALIINLDGYSFYQLTSYGAVDVMLKFISTIMPIFKMADYGFFINLNYVSYGLLKILSPVLGDIMDRIQVESGPEDWLPAVRAKIPMHYLPPAFGGYSNYTCTTPFCTFYRPHL